MNPPRVPASELPGTAIGLRTDTRGMETDVKTRAVWLPLAAMLAGLLLLAGACGGGGAQTGGGDTSATSKATKGGTLRIVLADDTDYVDPALAYYQTSWQFEYSTCLKLLNYPDAAGSEGNQLQPEAAEALPEVSADGKNYTFTVRQGLKFSPPSTEQVTPETFRFVVERALNPKMQSPAASFVSDIQGASDFVAGRAKHVSGIKISGQTISFELTDVAPDFLSRIAMPFFCAIPTDTPIDPRGIKSVPSAGPYFVDSWTPNRTLVIKRNPNYTGDRPAYVDEIRYQMGVDPDQAVLEIKQGNADYLGDGPPPAQNAELGATVGPDSPVANTDKQMFHVNPILSTSYLAMNTSRPHFDNEKVRQAVNFAIDRQTILDQSGKYAGTPSDQILPPGVPGFNDADIYPLDGPDLEKARQLMQESGEQTPFEAVLYTCDTSPCPGQPEGDRHHRGDPALRPQYPVPEGGAAERAVRPGRRGLVRRLRRPVRLHQHPARRVGHSGRQQQQLRLLRRFHLECQDGGGCEAVGRPALRGVRPARRRPLDGSRTMGLAGEFEPARPVLRAGRRAHVPADLRHGLQPDVRAVVTPRS
jgi:ABC-type transport system substrate-binding protein